jgi:O-antigen/teichoic acid export membrane protein
MVLSLGLQATAARRISVAPDQTVAIERMMLAVGLRTAAGLGAVCLALAPLLDRVLHLDSLPIAALLSLTVAPLTYMGVQAGILQGERRWGALSALYVALGLGRVLFGVVLMAITPTAFSAMLGVALGVWLPVLVGHLALRHPRAPTSQIPGPTTLDVLREIAHSSQALLAFFALSNVDILVARAALPDTEAGLYAGGLILARAVLVLPQFVVLLAFPAMAARHSAKYALMAGLAICLALGAVVTAVVLIFPSFAALFIGGDDFSAIADDLWLFAVSGTVLTMVQLLVYSTLASGQRREVLLTWLALVGVVAGALAVHTATSLLTVVIVVDGTLLLVLLALVAIRPGRRDKVPTPVVQRPT